MNDEESMSAAVAAVEEAEGAVGALVNNAGYSQSGAVETIPLDERAPPVRDQRVRPACGCASSCCRDAPARARPDRERQLDGRQARPSRAAASTTPPSTRSRRSPTRMRFEVARLRRRTSSMIEPGLIRTSFAETAVGLGRRTRTAPTRSSTPRWPRPPPVPTTARSASSAAGPRPWPRRSRRRSPRAARAPATG